MTCDCASNSIGNVPSTAQPDKNNNDSPHHAPPHVDKNDSNSLPPPTGSTMVLTPHVSQAAPGVIYDLEKETHGEWMTVARRKKPVKPIVPNSFEGLKNTVQQTNNAMPGSLGKESLAVILNQIPSQSEEGRT